MSGMKKETVEFSDLFWVLRTDLFVTEDYYLEPSAVHETTQGDAWDKLQRSKNNEVKAIQFNKIWGLGRPPIDNEVTQDIWEFKLAVGPGEQIEKIRLPMAKRFKQVLGQDYFETFETDCEPETFRF